MLLSRVPGVQGNHLALSGAAMTVASFDHERLLKQAKRAGVEDAEIATTAELAAALGRVGWQSGLAKGPQGTPIGDERNVLAALRTAPQLRGLVRYDEFALAIEFARDAPWQRAAPGCRWTADDDTSLIAYLQEQGLPVRSKAVVADCVSLAAKDARVHPVREYLHKLEWDGEPRLDSWLVVYLKASGNVEYLGLIGRCWMTSAIARVMAPGAQVDTVMVLEGRQGCGKSSTARILAVKPAWYADSIGDVRNKDSAIQLSGKWIIEIGELAAIRRAEIEAVKTYLSRTADVFRPPYERRAVTVPRQTVFLGSTNEHEYLRDRTGNRRYWPIRCGYVDLDALERDRDQLWAEAVQLYRSGSTWHLRQEQEHLATTEQDERVLVSELEAAVAEYLEHMVDIKTFKVTTRDVFRGALNLDPESDKYQEQAKRLGAELALAMGRCGWQRLRRVGRTRRTTYQYVNRPDG